MTKAQLAHHIGELHGRRANANPLASRLQWSLDELTDEHDRLHAQMICQLCGDPVSMGALCPSCAAGAAHARIDLDLGRALHMLGMGGA